MIKLKTISAQSPSSIEYEVNKWLEAQPKGTVIKYTETTVTKKIVPGSQTVKADYILICIWYMKPEPNSESNVPDGNKR